MIMWLWSSKPIEFSLSNSSREIYCCKYVYWKILKTQVTVLIFLYLNEQKNKKIINKRDETMRRN